MEFNSDSEKAHTCSFTGYRPSKLKFLFDKNSAEYKKLYEVLTEEIIHLIENGVTYFQTGMALGIDLMCAEIVIALKKKYNVHLFCVIPCINQCQDWKKEDILLYNEIIESASGIYYTSNECYTKGCMMIRNRYLVDNAEYVLAVYDGKKGGTKYTLEYAKKNKKSIIIINPDDYTKIELFHGDDKGVCYV